MREGRKLLAVALLAAGCNGGGTVVAQTAQPAPHEVAAFFEVEFGNPMAFNCTTQDTCLTCTNVSGGASEVVVTHQPTAEEEAHSIAVRAQVRICGNVVFLPHEG